MLDVLKAAEIVLDKYSKVKFCFAGAWSAKEGNTQEKAFQIINEKGLAKLVVALAKGKKQYDKRESLKEKDDRREMDRMFKR